MNTDFNPEVPFKTLVYYGFFMLVLTGVAVHTSWNSSTQKQTNTHKLDHIPTVGFSGALLSYLDAVRFLFNARGMIEEGYEKNKASIFKVATLNRWIVIVTGPKLIEELRKVPDDQLSFIEAANELVQIPYTLGASIATDSYHVAVLGTQLTRNMGLIFPEIRDEMLTAFGDIIPSGTESGWTEVSVVTNIMQIMSRVGNRIFVGPVLCRNPDFVSLNMKLSREVLNGAIIVSLFPKILKPFAARLLTGLPRSIQRMERFLQPIVEERQQKIGKLGRYYPQKPNDLISWLLDEAEGIQQTQRDLTLQILAVNFAATYTSSMSFTHALYHLAANPEFVQPLRAEIEGVIKQDGWTKPSVDRMYKVDSFLKESMRYSGLRALSMMRKALRPYTFSDGTHIPEGTFVFAGASAMHLDPIHYRNGDKFDGFRFADLRQQRGRDANKESSRYQLVTATADYLAWGYGRRACPRRFFAALELKLMLAHLVMNYDVKFSGVPEGRPSDFWVEANLIPNFNAKMMFKKRDDRPSIAPLM